MMRNLRAKPSIDTADASRCNIVMKLILIGLSVLMLFIHQSANAQNCVPVKYESILRKICEDLTKITKEELQNSQAFAELMNFDDCGLTSAMIYGSTEPLTVLKYPMKPFFENVTNLSSLPLITKTNPFVEISKDTNKMKVITVENVRFPLGSFSYLRAIHGMNCSTRDAQPITVTTSQVQYEPKNFIGSHILALSEVQFKTPEIAKLLNPQTSRAEKEKLIMTFAQELSEKTVQKTASALNVNENDLKKLFESQINSPTFLTNILESIDSTAQPSAQSAMGSILHGFERVIGASPSLRRKDLEQIYKSMEKTASASDVIPQINELKVKIAEIKAAQSVNPPAPNKKIFLIFGIEIEKLSFGISLLSLVIAIFALLKANSVI